jgi:hypothetical protein
LACSLDEAEQQNPPINFYLNNAFVIGAIGGLFFPAQLASPRSPNHGLIQRFAFSSTHTAARWLGYHFTVFFTNLSAIELRQ